MRKNEEKYPTKNIPMMMRNGGPGGGWCRGER